MIIHLSKYTLEGHARQFLVYSTQFSHTGLPDYAQLPYNRSMNPASSLYQLQQTDTKLKSIDQRIAEIRKTISGDKRVLAAQQAIKKTVQQTLKAQQALRTIEEKAKEVRDKLETSNAKLYGGRITNPKELQDIQLDVAASKKRLAALEDKQLTAMIGLEEAETAQSAAENLLQQTEAQTLTDHASLNGELSQLTKTRDRLLSERDAISGSIEPSHLDIYDQLIKTKFGTAVIPLEDDTCTACGATIRSATLQAARSPKEITFCPTCKRIIFAG
jgi:predicted  nucleic acid-binding Zn-ribbon protein